MGKLEKTKIKSFLYKFPRFTEQEEYYKTEFDKKNVKYLKRAKEQYGYSQI
ncbi:hypothetical protein [Flavobacterium aestivum]|uniref:hypothetical protein n=1 Tax=Flavobacterium aestivum TaxID=3003257 RepID=UPI002285B7D4|nr:hypothetical protein [Flavobacterium aestivum]